MDENIVTPVHEPEVAAKLEMSADNDAQHLADMQRQSDLQMEYSVLCNTLMAGCKGFSAGPSLSALFAVAASIICHHESDVDRAKAAFYAFSQPIIDSIPENIAMNRGGVVAHGQAGSES